MRIFAPFAGQIHENMQFWKYNPAPLGFTDFSSYIKQIRPDVDALFISTGNVAAEKFLEQYQKIGPKLPLIGGGPSFDEVVLSKTGDAGLGALSVFPYSASLNTPANKRFVAEFRQMYGRNPGHFADCGYTSGMWIAQAAEAVKGDVENKPAFLKAIKAVELKNAARGSVKLDEYGNPIENFYVRKVERVNGNMANVVIYTFTNVSQFWKYKPEEFLKDPPYSMDFPPCKYCPAAPH
jgi:branched-chain amino acid transport system substrate-binding protein